MARSIRRVSARTRASAIQVLDIAASHSPYPDDKNPHGLLISEILSGLGYPSAYGRHPVSDLVWQAYAAIAYRNHMVADPKVHHVGDAGDAAGLLRDGWLLDERVVKL